MSPGISSDDGEMTEKNTEKNTDKKEEQTEERILEAAQRVFVRKGISGARTKEIAEEAGVNRALINYYFRSRDKLADAVFKRVAGPFLPRVLQAFMSEAPLREKLQEVVDLELDQLLANPYMPLYILTGLQYYPDRLRSVVKNLVPVEKMRNKLLNTLQEQIDAEVEAGHLRPTKAEDLIITLMSMMIFPFAASVMIETVFGLDAEARKAMIERRREDLVDIIFKGFGPR